MFVYLSTPTLLHTVMNGWSRYMCAVHIYATRKAANTNDTELYKSIY